jgi:hypothetical protein
MKMILNKNEKNSRYCGKDHFYLFFIKKFRNSKNSKKNTLKSTNLEMSLIDLNNNRPILNGSTVFFGDQVLIEIKSSNTGKQKMKIIFFLKLEKINCFKYKIKTFRSFNKYRKLHIKLDC